MPQWWTDLDTGLLLLFNGGGNAFVDSLAITYTSTLTWLPFFLGALIMLWRSELPARHVYLIIGGALLGLLIADGVAEGLVKPWVQRLRPCNEPELADMVRIVNNYRSTDYSFFSGHATNTSMLALLLLTIVRQRRFTIAVVAWSLVNCYTRLFLAQHYPTDIITGLFWGSMVGVIIGKWLLQRITILKATTYQTIQFQTIYPIAGMGLSVLYGIVIAVLQA